MHARAVMAAGQRRTGARHTAWLEASIAQPSNGTDCHCTYTSAEPYETRCTTRTIQRGSVPLCGSSSSSRAIETTRISAMEASWAWQEQRACDASLSSQRPPSATPRWSAAADLVLIRCARCGSIALGTQNISTYLVTIAPPILACFHDPDQRVRYFACESMYNVAKVGTVYCGCLTDGGQTRPDRGHGHGTCEQAERSAGPLTCSYMPAGRKGRSPHLL